MSRFQNSKVRIEYFPDLNSWAFVDPSNPRNRMEVEQVLLDATLIRHHFVEGFVKASHGVDMEMVQYLDSRTRNELGIMGTHTLGRVGTLYRVRLMPGGTVERVD